MEKLLKVTCSPRVVFDLDGTLVDSAPSLTFAANIVLQQLDRPPVSVKKYKEFIGNGTLKQVEYLLEFTGGVPPEGLNYYHKKFLKLYNRDPLSKTVCFNGVNNALEALKLMGCRLSLCTQKFSEPATIILDGLDLTRHFDGFAFGDSLDVLKPDSRMVELATSDHGTGQLFYIGDSEVDAQTAKNSKAKFLLFLHGYRKKSVDEINPVAVFSDYKTVPSLIKSFISEKLS